MKNIVLTEQDYKEIDTDHLDTAIRSQLGAKFHGLSTSQEWVEFGADGVTIKQVHPATVTLHFDDTVTGSEIAKARRAYDEHDLEAIPPKPKIKTAEERIAELEGVVATLMEARGAEAQKAK